MLAVHFQATMYEVQAAAERLGSLDGRSLVKPAATAEGLLHALTNFGAARILYRFDQPVNVFNESLRISSSEPVVMGTRMTATGQGINTVRYQNVGAIIRLSARRPAEAGGRKGYDVTLAMEMSTLATSDTELAPGRKVTSTRNLSIEHTEALEYGRPRVVLAISSASTEEKTPPAMYVIRYLFNR